MCLVHKCRKRCCFSLIKRKLLTLYTTVEFLLFPLNKKTHLTQTRSQKVVVREVMLFSLECGIEKYIPNNFLDSKTCSP